MCVSCPAVVPVQTKDAACDRGCRAAYRCCRGAPTVPLRAAPLQAAGWTTQPDRQRQSSLRTPTPALCVMERDAKRKSGTGQSVTLPKPRHAGLCVWHRVQGKQAMAVYCRGCTACAAKCNCLGGRHPCGHASDLQLYHAGRMLGLVMCATQFLAKSVSSSRVGATLRYQNDVSLTRRCCLSLCAATTIHDLCTRHTAAAGITTPYRQLPAVEACQQGARRRRYLPA